ncbi:MAG: DUF1786 domain-containing protein [Chloroflexota bacterium]
MKILALDVGGLTQDILLFDTSQTIENCVKMIMPSPSLVLSHKMKKATEAKRPVFITGVNMGGEPLKGSVLDHIQAGLRVYATPEAATSFADNMNKISGYGIELASEEELPESSKVERINTTDIDLAAIEKALTAFEVDPHIDALAVAVLDHGTAPPGTSDRVFRFQHLRQQVEKERQLLTFAYLADEIPPHLTRMKAATQCLDRELPLLVMDTPVAAAFGAMEDNNVGRESRKVIVNVGNFHTLAFHLQGDSILSFFEHHTRFLDAKKIDDFIIKLVRGEITSEEVYNDNGHGAYILERSNDIPPVAVTGPQRHIMADSKLSPYFAAPYGAMMLTGCFGLVRAFAMRMKSWQSEIEKALG